MYAAIFWCDKNVPHHKGMLATKVYPFVKTVKLRLLFSIHVNITKLQKTVKVIIIIEQWFGEWVEV